MDASQLPKGEPPGRFDELHLAARHRDAPRVACLIAAGADVNQPNPREPNGDGGNTPLWFAAQGPHGGGVPVAALLVQAGARVNERCEHGTTALHLAASWGHADMVGFLLAQGADGTLTDDAGRTPYALAQADYAEVQRQKRDGEIGTEYDEWLGRMPTVLALLKAAGAS